MTLEENLMRKVFERIIAGKSGLAVEIKKGQCLRVIDLEGKQDQSEGG